MTHNDLQPYRDAERERIEQRRWMEYRFGEAPEKKTEDESKKEKQELEEASKGIKQKGGTEL